jgi:PAS domain S-box-containing protein
MEHIHYDGEGNEIYVEVHGYPIFNAEGKLYRMIEYTLDITAKKIAERKLAETNKNLEETVRKRTLRLEREVAQREAMQLQLKESERYYRTLIEASHDLSMIIDKTGTIIYSSPSSQIILGFSPEQMVGKSLFDYLHKDDLQWGEERFAEFIISLQPKQRLQYRVLTCDGSYRVLEASVRNLLGDPAIRGLLLHARDITEKQLAEEELRKLQLVVEQNPSTIVITNLDGNIEYVNKQFEKVTGYTREEALGKNPSILNSGLTPSGTFDDLWETLNRGEIWNGEFINRSKSGEIYHENVLLAPLKDEQGKVTHYVAIKENITELKQAREAAEESNRAKSAFLSRMSHELRTPLNAINGFSQLLLRRNKKHTLDERQTNQVLQINTAGQHLLELINEILDLSRVESGQLAVSLEPIVAADAVMDCMTLLSTLAEKSGISLQLSDSIKHLPLIQTDRTRFKQVILNLLSNAIKYNRPQGTVSLSGKLDGNMISLEVADSGIGLSEEQLKDLYVPFTRFGQDKSGIEGTGIGMTITKQLVELMHGSLEVESEVGVGSVFRVKLPLAENGVIQNSQSPDVPMEKNTLSDGRFKGTILYIEDDLSNIQLMRNIMEQWPEVSLVVRKTAEKGIKAISMLQPDLVFMDLHLPGMSGQEALSELQKNPKTKNIKVIALSADVLPATMQECLDLGFTAYLTKPINIERLGDALDEYLPS